MTFILSYSPTNLKAKDAGFLTPGRQYRLPQIALPTTTLNGGAPALAQGYGGMRAVTGIRFIPLALYRWGRISLVPVRLLLQGAATALRAAVASLSAGSGESIKVVRCKPHARFGSIVAGK